MVSIRKHNFQAWLVPHAEGTLDAARTALLEAQMARDPALAAEAARVRGVTAHLHQAASLNTSEADPRLALDPIPLWPRVQARLARTPRRLPRSMGWAGGLCAASLALAALLLHGELHGMGGLQTRPPVPVRLSKENGAAGSVPGNVAHARHKKKGRRTLSRPTHLALVPSKLPALGPTAEHLSLVSPNLSPPNLPAPSPAADASSAHTAVVLEDGSAHFRLASPVHEIQPQIRPRPASDTPAASTGEDAPAAARPTPPDTAPQTQDDPAPAQESPTTPLAVTHSHARKTHGHRRFGRHHPPHPAASSTAPPTADAVPKPAAAPTSSHAARAI